MAAAVVLLAGTAMAQENGDAARGAAFAAANCSECHEIRPGHYESPWFDVPSFEDIANAEGMSEIALFAFFRTSHMDMPNFVISPDDIRDLTAYLLTMRD